MPAAKLLKKSASAAEVQGPESRDLPSCKDIPPGTWSETALLDFVGCGARNSESDRTFADAEKYDFFGVNQLLSCS